MEYESNGNRDENLSIKENFDKIKPYLNNILVLTMHSKCDNIEVLTYHILNETIE